MGDPPIKRPTSKSQQNIIQHKIVAITTNLLLLLLLLLLLKTLKMELRQIGYSVKVRQLSLLSSSNDCCYILIIVQRDATQTVYLLFCKFTLHVSSANHTHHQEYTKL